MLLRRYRAAFVAAATALLLNACSQPPAAPQQSTLTLTLAAATVSALPGDPVTVQFTVTRDGGFDGAVAVSTADVPAGITPPSPITIAAGATSGSFALALDDALEAGDLELTIVAAGNGVLDTATLTIEVGELNGRIDTSFGSRGVYSYDVGYSAFNDLTIDGSGRIVAVGTTYVGTDYPLIVRLTADGAPDPGFGTNGVVVIDSVVDSPAYAVALDGSGRVVVAGTNFDSGDCFVARLTTSGALDASFDADGIAVIVNAPYDNCNDVLIDSGGKIVVVGQTGFDDALVARLNDDGTLDASFDADGIATYDPSGGTERLAAVLQRADDSLVGVGDIREVDGLNDVGLVSIDPDGSLDVGFGSGGYVATDFDFSRDNARAAAWVNGKLVAAGYSGGGPGGNEDMALVRYNADGSLDSGFGSGGRVRIDVAGSYDSAEAIAADPGGGIVVAGYTAGSGYPNLATADSDLDQRGGDIRIAVAVLGADGALDSSFNKDGLAVVEEVAMSVAMGVAVDGNGDIVIAGYGSDGAVVLRLSR